jgi:hypothetical protein
VYSHKWCSSAISVERKGRRKIIRKSRDILSWKEKQENKRRNKERWILSSSLTNGVQEV